MTDIIAPLAVGDAQMNIASFTTMISSATDEQLATILAILHRGQTPAAEVVKPTVPQKPAKEIIKKAATAPASAPAPVPVVEGVPTASDYLISPDSIDHSTCIGRSLKGGEDKRWKPIIFKESQCGGKLSDGSDLCSKCVKRQEKFAETGKQADWNGRVTEAPLPDCHMLDTEWAAKKQPKFNAIASSETPEENGSVQEEMPANNTAVKADKAAAKAAAAEAKAAAKAAEKAAAAEAKAAAKAATKATKKSEKVAAKTTAKTTEVKVTPASEPVEVEGELKLIDGTLYMVKKGNVYEYEELTEKAGDFVGRLTADETIDTEAEEVSAEESDSE